MFESTNVYLSIDVKDNTEILFYSDVASGYATNVKRRQLPFEDTCRLFDHGLRVIGFTFVAITRLMASARLILFSMLVPLISGTDGVDLQLHAQ